MGLECARGVPDSQTAQAPLPALLQQSVSMAFTSVRYWEGRKMHVGLLNVLSSSGGRHD
jgi:hypothetical protein